MQYSLVTRLAVGALLVFALGQTAYKLTASPPPPPPPATFGYAHIGTVEPFAGNFAPRGWMKCEGQLLPIAQYSALFSLLGTIYGGDGRTTFALPDLRGRVPVGAGSGPGLSPLRIGQKIGNENATVATRPVKPWSSGGRGTTVAPQKATVATPPNLNQLPVAQPSLPMTYVICVEGIFPSRS